MTFQVNARCGICNAVSHSEIATNDTDFYPGSFRLDPDGLGFTCSNCYSDIAEVQKDWDIEDELNEDKGYDL